MDFSKPARSFTATRGHFRTPNEGPVPRSKEKNDEFVQTWLQQTQTRHSHHSRPDRNDTPRAERERSHSRAEVTRYKKRSRSRSAASPPPPRMTEQLEHRFEKRARHKTRDDKYEYKSGVGHKHVSGQRVRGAVEPGEPKRSRADKRRFSVS